MTMEIRPLPLTRPQRRMLWTRLLIRLLIFVGVVLGLLLLVIVGCGIYCVTQARWQDVGILTVMGVAVFLAMFLLEWLVFTAGQWRASLGDFLHS